MRDDLKKDVVMRFPFDKRSPEPSKNYGVGSLSIWLILKGPKGAVQFGFMTGTYLRHVLAEWREKGQGSGMGELFPFDVGYHSPVPMHDGQTSMGPCEHLGGAPCYYDGSSLRAEEWMKEALHAKDPYEALWGMLEKEYEYRFDGDES